VGIGAPDYQGAALEMARGHGKSMFMKAMVLRAFLCSYYRLEGWGSRYAALLTSGTLYAQFSRDLGAIITGVGAPLVLDRAGAPLLHQDFWIRSGDRYPQRALKERQLWNVADKLLYIGSWDHPCRLSVRGMTAGRGDVRGLIQGNQRPDLLVIDDPMKESEAENEDITEQVKTFVKRSFIPCGSPSAKLAVFGTPFNARDLITEVCGNARSPALEAEWPGLARCALPALHPTSQALLCPQLWSREKLDERRLLIGSRAFFQEYLLDPQGGGLKHFEGAWLKKWTLAAPADRRRVRRVLFCDPSLGRSSQSDHSALVVLDRELESGRAWVRLADLQRRRPQKLVCDYLDLWQRFRPDDHACEDAGFQELLLPIFQEELRARTLPQEALPRLQSTEGVPKVQRIKRLSPLAENGLLCWDEAGDHLALRRQAENWGGTPNEADDGLDALEGALRLAQPRPTITGGFRALNG
jgi:hypothetical protein